MDGGVRLAASEPSELWTLPIGEGSLAVLLEGDESEEREVEAMDDRGWVECFLV